MLCGLCLVVAAIVGALHWTRAHPKLPERNGASCSYLQLMVGSDGLTRGITKEFFSDLRSIELSTSERVIHEGQDGEALHFHGSWEYELEGHLVDSCTAWPNQAFLAIERPGVGTVIEAWELQPQVGGLVIEQAGELGPASLQVEGGGAYRCPELRGQPEFERTQVASLATQTRVLRIVCDSGGNQLLALLASTEVEAAFTLEVLDLNGGTWTPLLNSDAEPALRDVHALTYCVSDLLGRVFIVHPEDMNDEWLFLNGPASAAPWQLTSRSYRELNAIPGVWEAMDESPLERGSQLPPPVVSEVLCEF